MEEVVVVEEVEEMEEVEEEMVEVEGGRSNYNFENMTGYSRVPLVAGQDKEVRLCHNETFCCEVAYSLVEDLGDLGDRQSSYHLVAYQGLRAMAIPGMMIPIQLCGVVQLCCHQAASCPVCSPQPGQSDTTPRFDFLRLQSRDFSEASLLLPSVLELTGQLADWNKITFDRTQASQADEGENKLVWNKRNQFKYVKKEKSFQTIKK